MWINRLIALALAGLLAACGGGSEPAASVAMAAAPSFDATAAVTSVVNASDPGSSLTVTKLTIVSSKRISRTIFEYAYNVTIANTSESQLQAVSATLVDVGSGTKIVAKSVTIGSIPAHSSVTSQGVVTFQQDRKVPFDPSSLKWTMSSSGTSSASAVIELLPTVIVPAGDEVANYSVAADTRLLKYSGKTPPPAGAVVVYLGSAYKLGPATLVDGNLVFQTTSPDVEEVFAKLDISGSISLVPAASSPASTGVVHALDLNPGDITFATDFTTVPAQLKGTLSNGNATFQVHYSLSSGWSGTYLSVSGTLAASANLRLKAVVKGPGESGKYFFKLPTLINIPIPSTLGTVAFKMPISIFVSSSSSIEVQLAHWDKTYEFVAGAKYNEATKSFENLSSFKDVSSAINPVDSTTLSSVLESVLSSLTFTSKTTVGSVTIGPQLNPELSALNDSIGAIGLRHEIGLKTDIEVNGKFPSLIDCADIPVSITYQVYAFLNHISFESLLDFEGETTTLPFKLISLETAVNQFDFGTCGLPVLFISPSNSTAQIGQSVSLTVTAKDTKGKIIPVPPGLTWQSSNQSVATVDSIGNVTGVGGGDVTILATDPASGANAQATVSVTQQSRYLYYMAATNVPCDSTATGSFTLTGGSASPSSDSISYTAVCGPGGVYGSFGKGPLPMSLEPATTYTMQFTYSYVENNVTDVFIEIDSTKILFSTFLTSFGKSQPGTLSITFTTPR